MSAGLVNFVIELGTNFKRTLIWKDREQNPIDLTGYSAFMQIRQTVDSVDFEIELTSAGGEITFTPEEGKIHLNIPYAETATITWKKAVFDLILESPAGERTRLIEGTVETKKAITR